MTMMTEEEIKNFFNGEKKEDGIKRVRFQPLCPEKGLERLKMGLNYLDDVNITILAELGQATMKAREILGLEVGSVIELERLAGEPVDIYINNQRFGCGEILVMNDNFAVRVMNVKRPVSVLRELELK